MKLSFRPVAPLLLLLLLAVACRAGEKIAESFQPRTPHEKYAASLARAGLDRTALGQRWLGAAEQALRAPATITLPFEEAGYFAESDARAVAFQFAARRGQRVVAEVVRESADPVALFVDLFVPPVDSAAIAAGDPPRHLTSADSSARGDTVSLAFEPDLDGRYLLRLQPELLRGVRYRVSVRAEASLAFPVSGRDSRAVQSFFGASRDGGRRAHHGVDIFAPRGTPVLAAANGWVRSVNVTPIGGKVVWVSDPMRGQSIYYAHLDSQIARPGDRVRIGDTLGLVGNTGNARSTPPHLHFGIYRRGWGPIDPFPFVHSPKERAPRLTADTGALGSWRRTTAGARRVALLSAPGAGPTARPVVELAPRTPLRIFAASAGSYRAELPDGRVGYVSAAATEPLTRPVTVVRAGATTAVLDRPSARGVMMDSVAAREALPVLGRYGDFVLVRVDEARMGWVADASQARSTAGHAAESDTPRRPARRRAVAD